MKHLSLVLLLLVSAAALTHADTPEAILKSKTSATIDWRGGSKIENLDWKFNGKSIGHGEQGFATLLTRLDELDDGAYLKVHYPGSLWNPELPDYRRDDAFPFLDRDDLRQKFRAIFSKKRMLLEEFSE